MQQHKDYLFSFTLPQQYFHCDRTFLFARPILSQHKLVICTAVSQRQHFMDLILYITPMQKDNQPPKQATTRHKSYPHTDGSCECNATPPSGASLNQLP
jgi:hypothetical protein